MAAKRRAAPAAWGPTPQSIADYTVAPPTGFEDPYSPTGYEDGGSCWTNWCCPGRCGWFTPVLAGLMFTMALLAIVFTGVAYMTAYFATTQTVYSAPGPISAWPQNAVLVGTPGALAMTMPNNVVEFAGRTYTIDCATAPHHTVTIAGGALSTTWDGTHTVATCGGPYTGFTFRVINNNYIRIVASTGITFT